MGIKDDDSAGTSSGGPISGNSLLTNVEERKKLYEDLDRQYEVGRLNTHTMKGLGLGFTSSMVPPRDPR
ncbi:unnamed protein product [Cyprideis torosa]|uniref:Uncharacterized protein n=1 Tax=Cyprideis torosa TaxID=163714 RepID=A0A7R8WPT0_9CRUS|nr:unnamed protein product [Cyprideis torosa]CAG0907208.1 unnamed protein product [Cyprideis torosa]